MARWNPLSGSFGINRLRVRPASLAESLRHLPASCAEMRQHRGIRGFERLQNFAATEMP